MEMHYIMTLCL